MPNRVLAFRRPVDSRISNGEMLYGWYRDERIKQGWTEFQWSILSEMQQLVWTRLAAYMRESDE